MGPEGRLAKLDALCEALRFMKVLVIADECDPLHSQATQAEAAVADYIEERQA